MSDVLSIVSTNSPADLNAEAELAAVQDEISAILKAKSGFDVTEELEDKRNTATEAYYKLRDLIAAYHTIKKTEPGSLAKR